MPRLSTEPPAIAVPAPHRRRPRQWLPRLRGLAAALVTGGIAAAAHGYTTFEGSPKWGLSTLGTPAVVTWSLLPEGTDVVRPPTDPAFIFSDFWAGTNALNSVYAQLDPNPVTGAAIFRQALVASFATWSAAAGVTFVEVGDDASPLGYVGATTGRVGDIRVGAYGFLAPFDAIGAHTFEPPGGTSSLAAYWATTGQQSDFGDVNLNAYAFFSTYAGLSEGQPFGTWMGNDLQGILTHEIGHALGLSHPEDDGIQGNEAMAIMYVGAGCCDAVHRQLGSDDIAGIQSLYGPAVPIPEPGAWLLLVAGLTGLTASKRRAGPGSSARRLRLVSAAG